MDWLNNGQSVKVPVGNYRIIFNDLTNYNKPTNIVVKLEKNENKLINQPRYIKHNGNIQIISTPGQWRIQGESTWRNSGDIINKPIGSYIIEFNNYNNYDKPNNFNIIILNNQNIIETKNYIPHTGSIQITSTPGQWRIQGESTWRNSGDIITNKFVGNYIIEFNSIDGYDKPNNYSIVVTKNNTSSYIGVYNILEAGYWGNTGLFGGGTTSTSTANQQSVINKITITTTNTSAKYGNLRVHPSNTYGRMHLAACSNGSRAIFAGAIMFATDYIDYKAISSSANTSSFGSLRIVRWEFAGCGNTSRGVFAGGCSYNSTSSSTMDYITIATLGNSLLFGSLSLSRWKLMGCNSNTLALFLGGQSTSSNTSQSIIDYVTIATTGNAIIFGYLINTSHSVGACSNQTRGIISGNTNYTLAKNIYYVEFSTLNQITFFGELTKQKNTFSACSNNTYGVFGGAYNAKTIMDRVTIATQSNATLFKTLTHPLSKYADAACSGN